MTPAILGVIAAGGGSGSGAIIWDVGSKASGWSVPSSARATCVSASPNFGIRGNRYVGDGKRYMEFVVSANVTATDINQTTLGVVTSGYVANSSSLIRASSYGWALFRDGTQEHNSVNVSPSGNVPIWGTSEVTIMCAIDFDSSSIWWGLDGVWANSPAGLAANPATGTNPAFTNISGPLTPAVCADAIASNIDVTIKTASGSFSYTPPSGFIGLGD